MTVARTPLVVLAAGGTGGHLFPAQALASELARRGCRLALITDRRGAALGTVVEGGPTISVRAGGIAGKGMVARVRGVAELGVGVVQAFARLGALRPDVVVGFGGYASVPTMLAASLRGIRTAIHEQNAVLGRANRLLASRVACIATSFDVCRAIPETAVRKVARTGMPVRDAIAAVRGRPYAPPTVDGPVALFVLGGSQGARVFTDTVPAAIGELEPGLRGRLRIAQQCRPEDLADARAAYAAIGVEAELKPFFDDVPERLAASHLVITRSGASTMAELTAVGRPSILVPYPHAIDDHQTYNAHAVDEAGGGWLMPQETFTPTALQARLRTLLENPTTLEKAAAGARAAGRPDAGVRLADAILALLPPERRPTNEKTENVA